MSFDLSTLVQSDFNGDLEGFLASWEYTLMELAKQPDEESLLALLEVIFGILLAWVWASETPGDEVLLGGTLVIGALVINELLGWRSRAGTPRIQTVDKQPQ